MNLKIRNVSTVLKVEQINNHDLFQGFLKWIRSTVKVCRESWTKFGESTVQIVSIKRSTVQINQRNVKFFFKC